MPRGSREESNMANNPIDGFTVSKEDFKFIGQGPQGGQEAGALNDDTYIGFFDHM